MQPILVVDLSTGEMSRKTVSRHDEEAYLGGSSLAARLLYNHLTAELDPHGAQAPLLFLNGPLSGSAGPAVGRFVVAAKSPATGLWGEANCGGFWGPELRRAGFDGLWLTGSAPHPVYLWICDGQAELRPADHLWGLDTYQTQQAVAEESLAPQQGASQFRVAAIGPAGEQQLPFALILTDHGRVAGRTGMGAVMGAKKLKAVAVAGSGQAPLADVAVYQELRSAANRALRDNNASQVFRALGTASGAEYFDYLAELPKRYYQRAYAPEELRVTGAAVAESILAGVSACHACVIACGRVVRLEDGARRKGPEYETLAGFGPNLALNDPALATRLGELCDRYGMDSISLSNTIGLAFTLYDAGRITPADTGGMALTWGDGEVVEQLVHQTGRGEGFGVTLGLGARGLGRHFGAEGEAVQVNGLELPYHDPRGATGMALVYATSPRGACHNQSDYFMVDVGQAEDSLGMQLYARLGGAEKAANVARHQDWRTFFNSLVMCIFANLEPQTYIDLVNAACGLEWELADALRAGERAWNLKRAINHRLGLRGEHDRLPAPLLRPYQDDPRGLVSRPPDFDAMLQAYYAARGWDPLSGRPTSEKLEQLGLEWVSFP